MSEPSSSEPKKRDPFPFYPLALSVFPVLSVYSANLELVPPGQTIRALGVSFAAGLLLLLVFSAVWRSTTRGAISAAVALAWLWSHQQTAGWFYGWEWLVHPTIQYAAAGLALSFAAGALPIRPKVPNLVSAMVLLVVGVQVGYMSFTPPRVAAAAAQASPLPPGPRPDVFHIMLDGFGRQDQVKRVMGLDLGWFVEGLRERGFQVADRARTNYVQTELSVSSTLNMDYLQNLVPDADPNLSDRRIFDPLVQESAATQKLVASGYQYLAMGSRFEGLRLGKHELAAASPSGYNLLEGVLLDRTPWTTQESFHLSRFERHQNILNGIFRRLEQLAEPTATPRVVFVHVLAPHPPFVFGPQGEPARPAGPFGYWDGSDFMTWVGTPEDYRAGYADQVQYIARVTLQTVDALLAANPDNPPVIIVQGDHGSKLGLNQESLELTDVPEAFSILYAVHTPPSLPIEVEPDASPVNTYRKLFRAMGVPDLPDLENRSWFSPHFYPFRFTEVTDQLD